MVTTALGTVSSVLRYGFGGKAMPSANWRNSSMAAADRPAGFGGEGGWMVFGQAMSLSPSACKRCRSRPLFCAQMLLALMTVVWFPDCRTTAYNLEPSGEAASARTSRANRSTRTGGCARSARLYAWT